MNLLRVSLLVGTGFMLWVFYLAIPAFYLDVYTPGSSLTTALVLISPILLLGAGIYFRHRAILLCIYPVTLLLPIVLWRELASAQLYSAGTFAITSGLTIAYLATVLIALRPDRGSGKDAVPLPDDTQRRDSIRWPGIVAASYLVIGIGSFIALISLLNFSDSVSEALKSTFKGNRDAARIQLNLYGFFLWVTVFFYYLVNTYHARFTGEGGRLKSVSPLALRWLRPTRRALVLQSLLALLLLFAFAWVFYYHR